MTLIVFSSLVETPIPPTDSYFTSDYELGVTDGSAQGSIIPIDSKGDTTPTNVAYLTNLGNEVLFEANDGVNGRQLWETNGTAGGTKLVKIINSTGDAFSDPGNQSPGSSQIGMIAIGSDVYFAANDGSGRNELWKSDGSATGNDTGQELQCRHHGEHAERLRRF
jgi:ELWxxDGT repeat protein